MIKKVEEIIKSERVSNLKKDVVKKTKDLKRWVEDHKEESILIASVGFGIINSLGKTAIRQKKDNKQERRRKLEWYDHRLGHWYKLRREATNTEKLMISRRQRNGESLGDILNDLNLLK